MQKNWIKTFVLKYEQTINSEFFFSPYFPSLLSIQHSTQLMINYYCMTIAIVVILRTYNNNQEKKKNEIIVHECFQFLNFSFKSSQLVIGEHSHNMQTHIQTLITINVIQFRFDIGWIFSQKQMSCIKY